MKMTKSQSVVLDQSDIDTIQQAFDDPIKIQILFKIFKNPNISSKELKDSIFTKGTKIYYYLNLLSKENNLGHAIIISAEHNDETREHLIVKTYRISSWMEEIVKSETIVNPYSSENKNKKWHIVLLQKISIALLSLQLHEFESKSEAEIEKEIDRLPTYNSALITQKTADIISPRFTEVFNELCDLEDQKKPLFERLFASDYTVLLTAINMP